MKNETDNNVYRVQCPERMVTIMNKVILMGRLTKNPEIKYAGKDNDMAGARYTLAVNRSINVTESRKQILSPVSHLERVQSLHRNIFTREREL